MFLIDAGGTLMELTPKHKYSFPVILGMNPGEPLSTRAPRMKAYSEMVRDLDAGGAHYSQDLSEVDLSDLDDVKVRVNDPAGDVLVHLGSSDYLRRYKIYVTHAQGWRAQFQKLESVDLRYDNQIIVNPDVPQTAKPVALSPAAAKTAAAAGVKPAALITHIPPGDRAVPKPAFELTEKKLDPKATVTTKKPASKVKAKKTAQKPAASKKPLSSAKPAARAARPLGSPRAATATTTAKPQGGGPKPSPGVAKTQASPGPGQ
jgi:cell division protein FtsQ